MKTVRDILDILIAETMTSGRAGTGKAEALKELEELLIESLPDNKEPAISAFKAVPKSQMLEARNNTIYNQAVEDTRKAIKRVIGGK